MSLGAALAIGYGVMVLFSWPWLYGWRVKANQRNWRHISNSDLFEGGFEATFCALAWPVTWFLRVFALFVRVVGRTSNRPWWVPKSVRDDYRR